jgi:hypothetical protein
MCYPPPLNVAQFDSALKHTPYVLSEESPEVYAQKKHPLGDEHQQRSLREKKGNRVKEKKNSEKKKERGKTKGRCES